MLNTKMQQITIDNYGNDFTTGIDDCTINMPQNVHDNNQNDALASIDHDVHTKRFKNGQ